METIVLKYDSSNQAAKKMCAFIESSGMVKVAAYKQIRKNRLYKDIERGLKEVKEIVDGKRKAKTLDQLLDEIRNNDNN
ncbi:MAG: hypothetical protein LBU62_00630 [Bacteroidales bacterium]|jgi:exopolysaccharide biosynthesis protein|nr:hypothetical protein [Bacteroidales bacterium]